MLAVLLHLNTMTDLNPYEAPIATSGDAPVFHGDDRVSRFLRVAKPAFIAWEKLRVVYNILCVLFVIGLIWRFEHWPTAMVPDMDITYSTPTWAEYVFAGVISNLCFFAGPIFETYIAWLGLKETKAVRWFLLVLGVAFTMFGASVFMFQR